jgi:hypothetical protein
VSFKIVFLDALLIAGSIFHNLITFRTIAELDIVGCCLGEIKTRLAHIFNCLVRFLDCRIGRLAETSLHLFIGKSVATVFISTIIGCGIPAFVSNL